MNLDMFNLLTGSIFFLFMLGYAGLYIYDRQQKLAGVAALALIVAMAAHVTGQLDPGLSGGWVSLLSLFLLWSAYGLLVSVYAVRAKEPIPWLNLSLAIGLGLVCYKISIAFGADSVARFVVLEAVSGWIIFTCIPILRRKLDYFIDHILLWLNLCTLTIIFGRLTIIAFDIAPAGWNSADFFHTVLLFTSVLLGIASASLLFVAIGVDMVTKAQQEAITDPLTGLLNRRGLSVIVENAEQDRVSQSLANRAVLLFDIDYFKRVNDEYGHDAGDQVLTKIGFNVRQLMEYHGVSARSGGEEFIIFFNEESSKAAFLVAEHLRVAIGMLKFDSLPDDYRITVSMGLAYVREDEPLKRAVRRADTALYRAKDDGRNKLRLADGDTLPDAQEQDTLQRLAPQRQEMPF